MIYLIHICDSNRSYLYRVKRNQRIRLMKEYYKLSRRGVSPSCAILGLAQDYEFRS